MNGTFDIPPLLCGNIWIFQQVWGGVQTSLDISFDINEFRNFFFPKVSLNVGLASISRKSEGSNVRHFKYFKSKIYSCSSSTNLKNGGTTLYSIWHATLLKVAHSRKYKSRDGGKRRKNISSTFWIEKKLTKFERGKSGEKWGNKSKLIIMLSREEGDKGE